MSENEEKARVLFLPSGRRGEVSKGTTLLGAARALGADIDSSCGGRAICGRCQIRVMEGDFPKEGIHSSGAHVTPPGEAEMKYDRLRGLKEGRRLACQTRIMGDVVIDVPPESQIHQQVVRKDAEAAEVAVDPLVRALLVDVERPDMENPSSDFARLAAALEEEWGLSDLHPSPAVLPRLQRALRDGEWQVTAIVHQADADSPPLLLDIRPGFDETLVGLAVDIGSTTIAAHLTDLHTGQVLAAGGVMNPQIRFGEDLMSRVSHAMMTEGGTKEMRDAVREAVNRLAADVAAQAGLSPSEILDAVFVGNPVMHHLFLGIDPRELGQAPFALAVGEALEMPAHVLGLDIAPAGRAYLLPCIAGHVGADAAAVVLSEAPHERDEITLIVDVGTNAEIILGNRERLLACSSPTGPAFEGAQISSGQRAAPGAIERVRIDRETLAPRFKVIGVKPWSDEEGFAEAVAETGVTGICGSGIIEAVAEMYLAGIIHSDGRFNEPLADTSPHVERRGRGFAYILHPGEPEISVTQEDVRAIQLAKAALYAGARLLMDELGIDRVDRIRLAGAFGNHIDPLHAMLLGLIPDCPPENVSSAGNAAGTGARMALVSREARREIEEVVCRIEKMETAVEPRFQEHFVAAMAIPHATAPYECLARVVELPRPATAAQRPRAGRRNRRGRPASRKD